MFLLVSLDRDKPFEPEPANTGVGIGSHKLQIDSLSFSPLVLRTEQA